jgi:hypothetical protein
MYITFQLKADDTMLANDTNVITIRNALYPEYDDDDDDKKLIIRPAIVIIQSMFCFLL